MTPRGSAVFGDSAGATSPRWPRTSSATRAGPPISHQALIYPGVDLTMSFPSIQARAKGPMLTGKLLAAFSGHYLGPEGGIGARDPLVSPYWRDDLAGLPPALVQTADLDPLRDEGLAYAGRLDEAGVPVRATNYLGAVHGFVELPRHVDRRGPGPARAGHRTAPPPRAPRWVCPRLGLAQAGTGEGRCDRVGRRRLLGFGTPSPGPQHHPASRACACPSWTSSGSATTACRSSCWPTAASATST